MCVLTANPGDRNTFFVRALIFVNQHRQSYASADSIIQGTRTDHSTILRSVTASIWIMFALTCYILNHNFTSGSQLRNLND